MIDTRDRRASVFGLGLAALLVLPAPGSIDQPDRQQLSFCYRGITASTPVVVAGDLVTTANAYFARTVTTGRTTVGRVVTSAAGYIRRSVTTDDAER